MIHPLRSRVMVKRLIGDDLSEHCSSMGLGAADMLVPGSRDPVWAVVVEAAPTREHCPGASREHLEGRLVPGLRVLLRPGSEVMSFGGVSIVDSCAIAGYCVGTELRANGDHVIGKPSEEAAQAMLSTSLAIPEFIKTRGVCLTDADAGSLTAELFSAIPITLVSAGGGVAQDYRRNVTAPFTHEWRRDLPAGTSYMVLAPGSFRVYRAGGDPLIVSLGSAILGWLE